MERQQGLFVRVVQFQRRHQLRTSQLGPEPECGIPHSVTKKEKKILWIGEITKGINI